MRKVILLLILLVLFSCSVASAALVDNGDGTVTDTESGLMWQKYTAVPFRYTWQDALSYCQSLSIVGYSDWRLPNRNELQSLVDYSRYNPAIDTLLAPLTESFLYWSSTTDAEDTSSAWFVSFADGQDGYGNKSAGFYVRAVRAGQSGLLGHLIISKSGGGAGTVSSSPAGIACGATCSNYFTKGAAINLTATPDPGSTFTGWSGGVCSGTSATCQVTMDGDKTVTATFAGTAGPPALYFPHIDTSVPWQTEIAVINTSDQTVTGTLRGISNDGQLVETRDVTLPAHGRRQITVANEFTNHLNIGYIIFDTNSAAVRGYTKFYQTGIYRAAIPAVKEVNTSDIYISHIDSSALWWTGASLVNTTSTRKDLTITFNDGRSVPYALNANQHRTFTIGGLLNEPLQPDIRSAVISNAGGVIGLELFGSIGSAAQMDGILLTDKTASTLYYPHVAGGDWWTGIVAYNPAESAATITITPYSAQGTLLAPSTLSIAGKGKYVGVVTGLGLPAETAWFRIDSTSPLSGFELFGTVNGNQVAAYAGSGGTGARAGVFAKIEKNGGWTGIAFVNTEDGAASVTLTAYNDSGAVVATQVLPVGGHAKVVNYAEAIFTQNISGATYIAYSADRNVVGFQLNGTSDNMMLDGLPGLGGTN